jgi:Putative mono-oxygenase ydhR
MRKLVQFDFKFNGPFGEDMTKALEGLARSINDEPGFVWKIWTENPQTGEAGGIYVFADEAAARDYIEKHTERLKAFGITTVNVKIFNINEGLTRLTKGPNV